MEKPSGKFSAFFLPPFFSGKLIRINVQALTAGNRERKGESLFSSEFFMPNHLRTVFGIGVGKVGEFSRKSCIFLVILTQCDFFKLPASFISFKALKTNLSIDSMLTLF